MWTVKRTNQRYSFLGREGESSVIRAGDGRPFSYKEKRKWVPAYFPLSCEDLTEALLEFTAADSTGGAASISPLLATIESEATLYAKCD